MNGYTGEDIFYILLGVATIIIAMSTAAAIPQALRMIERITLADKQPGPLPPKDPWGPRP